MSKRTAVLALVVVLVFATVLAACTRPKPPVAETKTPVSTAAGVEVRATVPPGTPAVVPTGATVIAVGPTPTYEMPTLTPPPAPTATPSPATTPVPPTATPAPTATPVPVQHVVQWGDTVYSLARRYGTTVEAIAQANNLPPNYLIKVGQVLIIPGTPVSADVYVVKPGDTLYSIATRYGISWQTLASVNRILNPSLLQVGQRLIIPSGATTPPPGAKTHIVKPGETLYRIALMYGTSVQAIALANNLSNVNIIYPGQQLIIP
ncbi:MAG: LysM peptidoglycan-binding domain-containing protein [Anaerolineae bacterium]